MQRRHDTEPIGSRIDNSVVYYVTSCTHVVCGRPSEHVTNCNITYHPKTSRSISLSMVKVDREWPLKGPRFPTFVYLGLVPHFPFAIHFYSFIKALWLFAYFAPLKYFYLSVAYFCIPGFLINNLLCMYLYSILCVFFILATLVFFPLDECCINSIRSRRKATRKVKIWRTSANIENLRIIRAKTRHTIKSTWQSFVSKVNSRISIKKVCTVVRKTAGKPSASPIRHLAS